MTTYDQIAAKIIKEQELLMGPVAWLEAEKVGGLKVVDRKTGAVSIVDASNNLGVIDSLVNRYGTLFGRAAKEVCKESVINLVSDLSPSEVPASLR